MEGEIKNKESKMNWRPVIFFYVTTTAWIVVPLLIGLFLGQNIAPGHTLIFVLGGFLITCIGLYKEIKKYQKELAVEDKKKTIHGK